MARDYVTGQDNIKPKIGPFNLDIHNPVFVISGLTIILFVLGTLLLPEEATSTFGAIRSWVTGNFAWFFIFGGNVFVLFCLLLIVSPLGSIKLGGKNAKPDFGYPAWLAMLFAAGMGIGLMFYGVSEPLSHFTSSFAEGAGEAGSWAPLSGAAGDASGAQSLAMAASIYHWGLHPWAMYGLVALALAFFSYNRGFPLSIRSAFHPLLGDRVWGWTGHVIDITAVFATIFGLATSLGLGAEQATSGLNYLFGIPSGTTSKMVLIVFITAIALASVVMGLEVGVRRLSELNMVLALLLLIFVILVGPTLALISGFFKNMISYIGHLPALAQPFGRADQNFSQGWTSFYWAWWISWSPFVGMFIARISKGRTVREFMVCVLLVPSVVCALWMSVFGGAALSQLVNEGFTGAQEAGLPLQLFAMLGQLPLASITSFIGIVLVIVFFVTSSDSGSLVIDTITAGGKTNSPVSQRVFWCILEGLVAMVLLAGGGLAALQAMAVATGFPFAILLLFMCVSLLIGLRKEPR